MHLLKKQQYTARLKMAALLCCVLTSCQGVDAQRGLFNFERISLDENFPGGYGVELADIDGDSLLDVVALSINPAQFVWYKNPGWEKYSISTVTAANIDAAPNDIDGDGDVDLVLASGFSLGNSTAGGLMHWLENPGNPTQSQQWQMHSIGQVPTTHRVKWGDINGDGIDELLSLPIIGVGASAPDYSVNVSLRAYQIPQDPKKGSWPSVVLDQSLQMSHGLSIADWNDDGRDDILTASFYGVHLIQLASRGQAVAKQYLAMGNQEKERPAIGSSEIGIGMVDIASSNIVDRRFLATIEPWHGNEVVVYTAGNNRNALWNREVIVDDLSSGHALQIVDLDNDGNDEIVAGGRSEPFQLSIFYFDENEQKWQRSVLDAGGIAVSGLAIGDINADGFKDIIGIGSSSQNVVYYRNPGN
ncbi:MAG: VCBS repeat-containing protein [Pseudomonadales bacterium]|jgi:hypothetical protein|nr:VCBS repeat-containing protein [Pseudomonadales bacterium]MDB3908542.1 VCBS repeat-containing protein [Gammaproteobacteria bacterium]